MKAIFQYSDNIVRLIGFAEEYDKHDINYVCEWNKEGIVNNTSEISKWFREDKDILEGLYYGVIKIDEDYDSQGNQIRKWAVLDHVHMITSLKINND